ncbi:30815_t:CDS:2, partial [Racocetra persica]
ELFRLCGPPSVDVWKENVMHLLDNLFSIDISSGVTDYLGKINYAKWNIIDCLKYLDKKNCMGLVSENKEEILAEIKKQLHLISINQSSNRKAWDKAIKLYKNVEKQFQFKETIAFFIQMDEK